MWLPGLVDVTVLIMHSNTTTPPIERDSLSMVFLISNAVDDVLQVFREHVSEIPV